jgi:hypothetical protein
VSHPVVEPTAPSAGKALNAALGRLARDPRNPDALIDAGEAATALGDNDAALGFFTRADQVAPGRPAIRAAIAGAQLRLNNPVEALHWYAEAEKAGGDPAGFAVDRGLAYDLVGDNAAAIAQYRRVLDRAGDSAAHDDPARDQAIRREALSLAIGGDRRGADLALLPLLQRQDRAAWRAHIFVLAIAGRGDEAVRVAQATMPPDLAASVGPYLRFMVRLTASQQAGVANLGRFPRAAEIGRDDPPVAAYAAAHPRVPLTPTPAPVLAATTPATPTDARADRKRRKRGHEVAPAAAPRPPVVEAEIALPAPPPPVLIQPGAAPATVALAVPPPGVPAKAPMAAPATAPAAPVGPAASRTTTPPRPGFDLAQVPGSNSGPNAVVIARNTAIPPAPTAPAPAQQIPAQQIPASPAPASEPPASAFAATGTPAVPAYQPAPALAPGVPRPAVLSRLDMPPVPRKAPEISGPAPVAAPTKVEHAEAKAPTERVAKGKAAPTKTEYAKTDSGKADLARPESARPDSSKAAKSRTRAGKNKADDSAAAAPVPLTKAEMAAAAKAARIKAAKDNSADSVLAPCKPAVRNKTGHGKAAQSKTEKSSTGKGKTGRGAKAARAKGRKGRAAADNSSDRPARGAHSAKSRRETADADETCAPVAKGDRPDGPADVSRDAQSDDTRKGKTKGKLAEKDKPEKGSRHARYASRIWVQVLTGGDRDKMPGEWRGLVRKARPLKGHKPYLTPWHSNFRLLTGPFDSDAEAQDFIAELRKDGVSGFEWTSPAGQAVDSLVLP